MSEREMEEGEKDRVGDEIKGEDTNMTSLYIIEYIINLI